MTSLAAVLAVVVALAVGIYYARWLRAERSLRGAKRDHSAAGRGAWAARPGHDLRGGGPGCLRSERGLREGAVGPPSRVPPPMEEPGFKGRDPWSGTAAPGCHASPDVLPVSAVSVREPDGARAIG